VSKLLYLVRCPHGLSLHEFAGGVLRDLGPRLLAARPDGLKLSLSEPDVPRPFHLPAKADGVALISIWSSREPAAWTPLIASLGLRSDGYRVTESIPRRCPRRSADGERSPGVTMLTLFRQRAGIGRAEFIRRWHEGHSPMALRIHPLVGYIRNVVEERVTEGAAPFDGIVEEHFASDRDLDDPRRFYGGTLRMVPRMLHVLLQTHGFLDLRTLENHMLKEHWLLSPA
jgi:hypothetical protein